MTRDSRSPWRQRRAPCMRQYAVLQLITYASGYAASTLPQGETQNMHCPFRAQEIQTFFFKDPNHTLKSLVTISYR